MTTTTKTDLQELALSALASTAMAAVRFRGILREFSEKIPESFYGILRFFSFCGLGFLSHK
jgi:hypothetical protein